jgi:hypothetical protein
LTAGSRDPAVLFFARESREIPEIAAIAYFGVIEGSTTALRGGAESRFSKSAGSLTPPMS